MFSFSEMLVIGVLALILIGPKQLPEVARTLGRFINELRRSANVFTSELKTQVQMEDFHKPPPAQPYQPPTATPEQPPVVETAPVSAPNHDENKKA